MTKIIDGKVISAAVKDRVKEGVARLNEKGVSVGLAVIIVGEDPASKVYVSNKKKACEALGIISEEYALPEETTQEEILEIIAKQIKQKKDSLADFKKADRQDLINQTYDNNDYGTILDNKLNITIDEIDECCNCLYNFIDEMNIYFENMGYIDN